MMVEGDVAAMIRAHWEEVKSGVDIARVMHSLSSPSCTYEQWSRTVFWGKHYQYDFDSLVEIATNMLTLYRSGQDI